VIDALKGLTLVRGRYFWTPSTNELESVRKAWSRLFKTVFKNAGPFTSKPHIHRFRHTCACSLLVKGVSVDDVAAVLGHSDPQITLRYYSRWVKVRQDRLNSILKEAWEPESKEFRVIEGGKPAEKPAKAHHAATTKQRR
jgi:integrase